MTSKMFMKIPVKPEIVRAKGWSALRRKWVKANPTCAACGKSVNLAVHHIIPLHTDRTRELDETNLITLCENTTSMFCHYSVGHLAINWYKYDPNVVADAALILAMKQNAQG